MIFSRLGDFLIKYRLIILILLLLTALSFIPGIAKLNITVDMGDFFMKNDPVIENQKRFNELFNNNDFIGVLVESDDVFSSECLKIINEVGRSLKNNVPLAKDIASLAESDNPFMKKNSLKFDDSILLSSDDEIEKIRDLYSSFSFINGTLFSKDYKQAWVLLTLEHYPDSEFWNYEKEPQFTIGKAAYDTVKSIDSGEIVLTATGIPVYAYRKEVEMMEDLTRILIVGLLVALVVSIFIMRNIQGVAGSILTIGMSILVVLGIQGMLGTSIDSAFISVPILLTIGVSIGYTVHISRFFTLKFRQTGNRRESIKHALRLSSRPILFTAFTTIVALTSFAFVEIKPIQWVGLTSAACILVVYILSVTLYPIILSFGPNRKATEKLTVKKDWMEPMLLKYSDFVGNHQKMILIIFILISFIAAAGITQLTVDFNAEKMMGNRLQHMKDQIHIGQSEIANSDNLDLVISFPPGALKDPEVLIRISRLEKELVKLPQIKKTTSVNNIIRGFNFLTHDYDSSFDKTPSDSGTLRGLLNYFSRLAPETLYSWIDEDFSNTRVFIELSDFSSSQINENIISINKLIGDIFSSDTTFFMSGSTFQMAVMNQHITKGLIRSVLMALLMISVLMIIVFRSFRIGLSAMIPNIFPVAVAGGIMGFSGMPLEFVTMTIAPMIMGLAVDDTIHLVFHLKNDMKTFPDYNSCVRNTFTTVGSAITETTIILCMTFLVFTTSKINSIINMGVISSLGMIAAYLSDIFVTPVIIQLLLPKNFFFEKTEKSIISTRRIK